MKTTSLFVSSILFAGLCIASFTSCSSEVDDIVQEKMEVTANELHTCAMNFNAEMPSFESQAKTRAESSSWKDGDIVYLRFTSPLGITTGTAVYNSAKSNWTLSYYGSLYEGTANTCTAVFIENAASTEGSVVNLTERSAIFEDKAGSYIVTDGDLTVTATLTPKVGRMHFTGTAGKNLKVFGLSHFTSYDYNTDVYTNTNSRFDDVVKSDGYTDYAYVFFTDDNTPSIKLWVDGKEAYTRFLPKNVLSAGESGIMSIPTKDSHISWEDGLVFAFNNVTLKLIAIEGGSFTMGATEEQLPYAEEIEKPAHVVTLDSYCLAEIPVTTQLYRAVNNSSASTSIKPIDTGYSTWNSFVNTINKQTGANFVIPTEAQWEYAARGGKYSHNYLYSGSNEIDEVAWYTSNSGSSTQDVKQKKPNELGLYDMSGNQNEFTRGYFAEYTSASQTNPEGLSTGTYNIVRGGNYSSSAVNCRVTRRYKSNNGSYALRLAIQ